MKMVTYQNGANENPLVSAGDVHAGNSCSGQLPEVKEQGEKCGENAKSMDGYFSANSESVSSGFSGGKFLKQCEVNCLSYSGLM